MRFSTNINSLNSEVKSGSLRVKRNLVRKAVISSGLSSVKTIKTSSEISFNSISNSSFRSETSAPVKRDRVSILDSIESIDTRRSSRKRNSSRILVQVSRVRPKSCRVSGSSLSFDERILADTHLNELLLGVDTRVSIVDIRVESSEIVSKTIVGGTSDVTSRKVHPLSTLAVVESSKIVVVRGTSKLDFILRDLRASRGSFSPLNADRASFEINKNLRSSRRSESHNRNFNNIRTGSSTTFRIGSRDLDSIEVYATLNLDGVSSILVVLEIVDSVNKLSRSVEAISINVNFIFGSLNIIPGYSELSISLDGSNRSGENRSNSAGSRIKVDSSGNTFRTLSS